MVSNTLSDGFQQIFTPHMRLKQSSVSHIRSEMVICVVILKKWHPGYRSTRSSIDFTTLNTRLFWCHKRIMGQLTLSSNKQPSNRQSELVMVRSCDYILSNSKWVISLGPFDNVFHSVNLLSGLWITQSCLQNVQCSHVGLLAFWCLTRRYRCVSLFCRIFLPPNNYRCC